MNVLFVRRLALLGALLAAEWLPISSLVVTRRHGQAIARGVVVFASLFLTLGYLKSASEIRRLAGLARFRPISWRFSALHLGAMSVFLLLSSPLATHAAGARAILLDMGWFGSGILGIVSAAAVFIAPAFWLELFRTTGNLWMFALPAGIAAPKLVTLSWSAWNNSAWRWITDLTFGSVQWALRPFLPHLVSDRASLTIGSSKFAVAIGDACSGIEGIGLILVFGAGWLWLFRREFRFPRALLLLPAGIAVMFALNTARIVALVLIGNAGAPGIAMGGFHSQAGWIAFNAVALGFSLAVPRASWFTVKESGPPQAERAVSNPTVPYLLPLASILAAGMISRAASAQFEWLYPLRFFAAAGALWFCRRSYRELLWKPGWLSLLAGTAVFLMWIALDRGPHPDNGIAAGLASLSAPARLSWLIFRTLAAVVTVPIAEELAFRGFLLRRLVSSDFELVDFRRFTYFALAGSSVVFGLMHGDRWLAGTVAGVVYALVMLRRGHIGDAIIAHATTNALLAVMVLAGGNWQLW
jgi:exosortase E/protease (VPEID-CTERM system)